MFIKIGSEVINLNQIISMLDRNTVVQLITTSLTSEGVGHNDAWVATSDSYAYTEEKADALRWFFSQPEQPAGFVVDVVAAYNEANYEEPEIHRAGQDPSEMF